MTKYTRTSKRREPVDTLHDVAKEVARGYAHAMEKRGGGSTLDYAMGRGASAYSVRETAPRDCAGFKRGDLFA
jgi:hypothetical protein